MRTKAKTKVKFFPFSPGIPWQVRGNHIVSTLQSNIWGTVLSGRNAIVVAHGGLIESYVSLVFLEIINILAPEKKLYWCGSNKFNQLISLNGLATIYPIDINKEILTNYPIPIFLDQDNYFYFNVLNNYLHVYNLYGEVIYKNRAPILRQMINNTTLPNWNYNYLPQIRNSNISNELKNWMKVNKFYFNQPYICIFPDRGLSIHKYSGLGWTLNQIRSFGSMLEQIGVRVIVFTNQPNKYQNGSILTLPLRFDFIFSLLKEAKAVLSEEIDFLLLSGMFSKASLVARPHKHEFNINNNMRVIKQDRLIYINKDLNPNTALDFLINGAT